MISKNELLYNTANDILNHLFEIEKFSNEFDKIILSNLHEEVKNQTLECIYTTYIKSYHQTISDLLEPTLQKKLNEGIVISWPELLDYITMLYKEKIKFYSD